MGVRVPLFVFTGLFNDYRLITVRRRSVAGVRSDGRNANGILI